MFSNNTLAVIATRDNGTEEQIANGETGLFVPHRDPGAVAAGIRRLIANPPLSRRLGEYLRRKVVQEYSVAALIPRWEKLFDKVCTAHDAQQVGTDMPPRGPELSIRSFQWRGSLEQWPVVMQRASTFPVSSVFYNARGE